MYSRTYICSCIPLHQLYPPFLKYSEYLDSLSLNSLIYKYTSERNIAKVLELAEVAIPQNLHLFHRLFSSQCLYYSAIVVYTAILFPCNLTTGTPRPLCSNACYLFRNFCDEYTIIIKSAISLGIPISHDFCENTFYIVNKYFHYPNSSKDFDNDCFDFTGTLCVAITLCV